MPVQIGVKFAPEEIRELALATHTSPSIVSLCSQPSYSPMTIRESGARLPQRGSCDGVGRDADKDLAGGAAPRLLHARQRLERAPPRQSQLMARSDAERFSTTNRRIRTGCSLQIHFTFQVPAESASKAVASAFVAFRSVRAADHIVDKDFTAWLERWTSWCTALLNELTVAAY